VSSLLALEAIGNYATNFDTVDLNNPPVKTADKCAICRELPRLFGKCAIEYCILPKLLLKDTK
jgi:hypothetical protein